MELTHIYHSGVLAETKECYYLFDYYQGELPALQAEKPVFVFASHSHADHYRPELFEILEKRGMRRILAVLPNEIKARKYPEGYTLVPESSADLRTAAESSASGATPAFVPSRAILKVYHSQEYDLPCWTHIKTLLSTDAGVAFLLTCPEGVLYHAGDLNEWITDDMPEQDRKQMTGRYRASLRELEGISIDVACLPLDPRLGARYADGFLYFLERFAPKKVCPIHYWDRPDIIDRFLAEHPAYRDKILL